MRYRARVVVERKQIVGKWHADLEGAQLERNALSTRKLTGQLATADGETVATFLDRYIAGRQISANTADKYRDQARRIAAVIGDVPLTRLREEHVEQYRDHAIEVRKLSTSTVNGDLRLLGSALDVAARRGLLRVPTPAAAKHVQRPSAQPEPAPTIGPDQARRILEAVVGDPVLDVAVHLALGATMRRGEVLGLRRSAVDLEAGTIAVVPGGTYTRAGFGDPKSAAGVRLIPVPPFVIDAIRRHLEAQAVAPIGDALVLSNAGQPYSPTSLSRAWRLFRNAHPDLVPAGMTFHDLRHGAAQALVEGGISREILKRTAGWGEGAMPESYVHDLSPEAQLAVRDTMQRQLGPIGGAR